MARGVILPLLIRGGGHGHTMEGVTTSTMLLYSERVTFLAGAAVHHSLIALPRHLDGVDAPMRGGVRLPPLCRG